MDEYNIGVLEVAKQSDSSMTASDSKKTVSIYTRLGWRSKWAKIIVTWKHPQLRGKLPKYINKNITQIVRGKIDQMQKSRDASTHQQL